MAKQCQFRGGKYWFIKSGIFLGYFAVKSFFKFRAKSLDILTVYLVWFKFFSTHGAIGKGKKSGLMGGRFWNPWYFWNFFFPQKKGLGFWASSPTFRDDWAFIFCRDCFAGGWPLVFGGIGQQVLVGGVGAGLIRVLLLCWCHRLALCPCKPFQERILHFGHGTGGVIGYLYFLGYLLY